MSVCATLFVLAEEVSYHVEALLILMYAHQIEPIQLLHTRLKEFDTTIAERPVQPLIPNIAHTIQSELRLPLL